MDFLLRKKVFLGREEKREREIKNVKSEEELRRIGFLVRKERERFLYG